MPTQTLPTPNASSTVPSAPVLPAADTETALVELDQLLLPIRAIYDVLALEPNSRVVRAIGHHLDQAEATIVGLTERLAYTSGRLAGRTQDETPPFANGPVGCCVSIVPNDSGGYCIEQSGHRWGNYATYADAHRVCAMNFFKVI